MEKTKEQIQAEKAAKFDKFQASHKKSSDRRNMRIKLILAKAEAAGIVVTEKEVDEAMKAKK